MHTRTTGRPGLSTAALGAVLLLGQACGGSGDSPTSPSSGARPSRDPGFPAGTAFTVVSGEDDRPVAGARVAVGGRTYLTDAAGRLALEQRADVGAGVDVVAPGFLDRSTTLRTGTARLSLWPRVSPTHLDEDFTARIVYSSASGEVAAVGDLPLNRLREGTRQVAVVPAPNLLEDERSLAAHQEAAARVTAASGGQVVYSVGSSAPAGALRFDTRVDQDDAECTSRGTIRAYTRRNLRGGETVGGTIVFCSRAASYASTVTHELGHTFGLQHSPNEREVMASYSVRRSPDFGERESLVMRLLLQRPAGNRYPDSDRTAAASAGESSVLIVCPE